MIIALLSGQGDSGTPIADPAGLSTGGALLR
jgi:hypothetical protein